MRSRPAAIDFEREAGAAYTPLPAPKALAHGRRRHRDRARAPLTPSPPGRPRTPPLHEFDSLSRHIRLVGSPRLHARPGERPHRALRRSRRRPRGRHRGRVHAHPHRAWPARATSTPRQLARTSSSPGSTSVTASASWTRSPRYSSRPSGSDRTGSVYPAQPTVPGRQSIPGVTHGPKACDHGPLQAPRPGGTRLALVPSRSPMRATGRTRCGTRRR